MFGVGKMKFYHSCPLLVKTFWPRPKKNILLAHPSKILPMSMTSFQGENLCSSVCP